MPDFRQLAREKSSKRARILAAQSEEFELLTTLKCKRDSVCKTASLD